MFRFFEIMAALVACGMLALLIWREFEDADRPACIRCGGFLAPSDVATCRGCLH